MSNREVVWDKPIDVPEKWIQNVDSNVLKELPHGTQVESISPYGASYWTRTAEIQTIQADGSALSFFLKVTQKDQGKAMVSGEFLSMKSLHVALPYLTPTPIAWGTYAEDTSIHFFLCEFVDMTEDIPDPNLFGKGLAELHKNGLSPNGLYGFPVPTLQGTIPQHTEWNSSWEDFFAISIAKVFANEEKAQGVDPEIQELEKAIMTKVLPRLLRPLETGGRSIQPRLIHGDIWDGNTSTNNATNLPVIFDATCLYAHNELELAPLRPIRHKMRKPYVKAYFKNFPISAPEEDQDDRNALYCLRWDMNCSSLYAGNPRWRNIGVEAMKTLVAKYPGGYKAWAEEHGEVAVSKDPVHVNLAK
ncbi:Protein-ribulosamine 3-kinase-like protein [Lachnellula suecica]|uniref:protein-ribulosamine 3-kinase n=1 Tax=Lachnellula suecica TaxID=602035 RepID=A0A8T9C2B1_9HELO|nr:Protein-ribulosamine 3-kinase-like protein [Lachnellula suecica]